MFAAVAGLAAAVAMVLASWTVLASLDRLVTEPARYGAPWDAVVTDEIGVTDLQKIVTTAPDVVEAAGLYTAGGLVGGRPDLIVALNGLLGLAFTLGLGHDQVQGRTPARDSETALGETIMREQHLHPR